MEVGSIACRALISGKFDIYSAPLISHPSPRIRRLKSGIWGSKIKFERIVKVKSHFGQPCVKRDRPVQCGSSSSSDGNGSLDGNLNLNNEDYVRSSVLEAVEVRNGSDGFMIKMRDGRYLRCVHNNPQVGSFPDYAPHSAMVLKMEDGSDLLLPIIVLDMPNILLMAALRNVHIARPTIYNVMKELIDKMGYAVQLVRITKRVNAAYFAELYLAKVGNEKESISLDVRPSDAINIAVRCNVPIQVNRHLALSDGMRVVEPTKLMASTSLSDGILFAELDRPDGHPCLEATEFDLVRNMLIAAVEERYRDAAQWRDKLSQLRKKNEWK